MKKTDGLKLGRGWNKGLKGFKHSGSFKKGHKFIKGGEKGWFKKGMKPISPRNIKGCIGPWTGKKRPEMLGENNPAKRLEVREKISKSNLGPNHPNWQSGKSFEPYSTDWTSTLKKSIRQRDKYTCQVCGKEPAVYVHHIDYDKKNCNPTNLITLCSKCHNKTNFNRNYWLNYFKTKLCETKSS